MRPDTEPSRKDKPSALQDTGTVLVPEIVLSALTQLRNGESFKTGNHQKEWLNMVQILFPWEEKKQCIKFYKLFLIKTPF
jgi:hypothetical protein